MEQLPNDINIIIKDYVIFKPSTKQELQEAVDLWCKNREEAISKYSYISNWDTSLINDMSRLFHAKFDFNDNINNWNVSNVINMNNMFYFCKKFNQPLNKWNVSNIIYMIRVFDGAVSFNKNNALWYNFN